MRLNFRRPLTYLGLVVSTAALAAGGCGDDAELTSSSNGGNTTGTTTQSGGTGGQGGAAQVGVSTGVAAGGGAVDCPNCMAGETCTHGVCIPLETCTDDNDCQYDTYCDPQIGCQPWDQRPPGFDDTCIQLAPVGQFAPALQCEFATAPAGDAFPGHVDVQGTPIVAHVSPDPSDPTKAGNGPSIVAAVFTETVIMDYTEDLGVMRILNGNDCSLVTNLGGTDLDNDNVIDWLLSSASLAAGDLDGDSVPEIVAYGADGSTYAFTYKNNLWSLLWKAPLPVGAPWAACNPVNHRCSFGWAGAAIHDLDNDGMAEVIREGVVFDGLGNVKSLQPAEYATYRQGMFSVTANLDGDADPELTNGANIWSWSGGAWVVDAVYGASPDVAVGHVAVANFGDYGVGLPAQRPEIVIVNDGLIRIVAGDGTLVQGPIGLPGGGVGGTPTVSDFDGDGLPEVAVADRGAYTIFDLDCGANPRPNGTCSNGVCDFAMGPCPAGIAWSRTTQDVSSSVTGSSVFDFEGDGKSEVVYGDECFTRVYDGESGEVLFSQFRSSCTWYENPIIADVDGDFRAELVTPSNRACAPDLNGKPCPSLNADAVDPQFNGLRCQANTDCVSGNCDAGLCRCSADAECCAAQTDAACLAEGNKCAPPNAGTAGTGNTCRAAHPSGVSGIRIYSDAQDKWVSSRRVWNQHAYAVTHVHESGAIPATSNWVNNWDDPTLNNFRQNVPGNPNGQAIGDATAGAANGAACVSGEAILAVDVCNRGALPVGAGLPVGFYVNAMQVCSTVTLGNLAPGACERVMCTWTDPPNDAATAVDVEVVADDGGTTNECKEGNNIGGIFDVFCIAPN